MFPKIINARILGSQTKPFIQSTLTAIEYELDERQLKILLATNGRRTLAEIAELTQEEVDSIKSLFEDLQEHLVFENEPSTNSMDLTFDGLPREPYLHELHYDITNQCNLNCPYCYTMPSMPNECLSWAEKMAVLDACKQLRVARLNISGGEACLMPELLQFLQACKERELLISTIFTNGTIRRTDILDWIVSNSSVTRFAVSLDGIYDRMNGVIRGEGNLAKTEQFISDCLERNIQVVVNTIVTGANYKSLPEIGKYLRKLGVKIWRISLARPQGRSKIQSQQFIKDVFRWYAKLIRWSLQFPTPSVQIESFFKPTILKDKEYYTFSPTSPCCEYKQDALCVKPDGQVLSCTALYSRPLGSVKTHSLADIWYSALTQQTKKITIAETQCCDCKLLQYCGGGCRQIAFELEGSWLAKDRHACFIYENFVQHILPLYQQIGIKPIAQ